MKAYFFSNGYSPVFATAFYTVIQVFLNIDENQSIKSNNWLRKRALTMKYTYIDY